MIEKALLSVFLISAAASAGVEIRQSENSISAWQGRNILWTFNHAPAEGKPYFHPLASTDGTVFTDMRPADHPWHRGVWFSWKFINGVNYWEENRETGKSAGETRIRKVEGSIENRTARIRLEIEYAPAGIQPPVMKERRLVVVSPPDESGVYFIDWSSTFKALEHDVVLDRTPIPGQPDGKAWGGYAGWSVRLNPTMKGGLFCNPEGKLNAARAAASWMLFTAPTGGNLLFMDHPDNFSYPSKWYITPGMPYFSPAVIHDGPHTLMAGESLGLAYRLVVYPGKLSRKKAAGRWNEWTAHHAGSN